MKNSFKLFLAAAAFVGFAANANAQASDNASATAYARIISPINIESNETNLEFGSMVSSNAGTVTVSTLGARSASGVITVNQGSNPSAAGFNVTGEPGYIYSITLPANNTVSITNGIHNLAVNNFTSSVGNTSALNLLGSNSFTVGGTLTVVGGESTGLYSGSFSVTVAYN